ncbi:hypothetical protein EB061_12790, partial [bacterium]|nr:hypothetical protein [bacterium]
VITLRTAGSHTITASDGTITTSANPTTVNPAAFSLAQSTVTLSSSTITSGSSITATLTTKDAFGNLNPSGLPAASEIAFTASSVGGTMASISSASAQGSGVFTASLTGGLAGAVTVGATISGNTVTSSVNATVVPGAATQLTFNTLPGSSISGSGFTATVYARDPAGNISTSTSSNVTLTSSDPAATGLGTVAFSDGIASFTPVLNTAGLRTLTATSGALSVTSANIDVTPGLATSLALSSVPATTIAGAPFSFGVTAKDNAGNTVTDYPDSVAITSSDSNATLPSASPLSSGVGTFSVTLKTAGSKTVTATGGSLSVTSSAITVTPGAYSAASSTTSIAATTFVAGETATFTLTTKDAYGNLNPTGLPATTAFTVNPGT